MLTPSFLLPEDYLLFRKTGVPLFLNDIDLWLNSGVSYLSTVNSFPILGIVGGNGNLHNLISELGGSIGSSGLN